MQILKAIFVVHLFYCMCMKQYHWYSSVEDKYETVVATPAMGRICNTVNNTIYRQRLVYIFICSDTIVTCCVIYKEAHSGDSLAAAKVFGVSSLCYDLPRGLVGEVYGGKRQRPPLLQNLGSDEYVLSHLGSGHVSARHWRLFPVICGFWS